MASIKDDRGYNQGFALAPSTTVRMERRTDWLLSEMTLTSATRILEIGCGTGEVSHWMAERSGAQVTGTDLCVPFIEEARRKYERPNLRYEVADFNDTHAFPSERFDYIVGNGILHHLYDGLDDVCASMLRLLAYDGKIIFLEPNLYNPYVYLIFSYPWLRTLAHLEPDEMAFSKPFIRDTLARAGFENIHVDYKDFLLPGIPDFAIQPSIRVGDVIEKVPGLRVMAQSLFIRAQKPVPPPASHA
jgi:SAM-dependent methyltransferase